MSILHRPSTTGAFHIFGCGDRHTSPDEPAFEPPIFSVQVAGLQGEGHLVDEAKGDDLELYADYYGAVTEAFLRQAIRVDRAKAGQLRGELVINGISFGTATFRALRTVKDDRGNAVRIDGKNGLFYATCTLLWRLH
jgi:hypothetical protein